MTVKIHEAAQTITNKQLAITPVEILDIDSRFLRTKVCAPGSNARTWLITYFSTSSVPKMRLPIVSNNNSVGNNVNIEKYETAAAEVVRSLCMNSARLCESTFLFVITGSSGGFPLSGSLQAV